MRPINYPQAKAYLMEVGVWFENMEYYDGWSVLVSAQFEFDKRNKDEH